MADTNTANIALLIADLNDTFNFGSHVEANFTTIDSLMGVVKCTSSTRPSNTYGGQGIYETDTARVAVNTNTKASPTWTYVTSKLIACTSGARPTVNLVAGLMAYETDTNRIITYTGAAWQQPGMVICTAATHPAVPIAGGEIFETDTGATAIYTGSAYSYNLAQIATQTLVGTTASVTFSSIPAYTMLLLAWRARSSAAGTVDLEMQLDGVTTSSYLWSKLTGNGSTASATHSASAVAFMKAGSVGGTTASYFSTGQLTIGGWANATGFANISGTSAMFDAAGTDLSETISGQYNAVGPHTSLKLLLSANSFAAGSQFALYGVM